jgi:diamine N-acetyltransferase
LTELRNDIAIQGQLLARARGSRPEQVREWLQNRTAQADRLLLIIADQEEDKALGFVQVSDLNPVDAHATLGICLLSKAQGHGRGSQAIGLLASYLRDQWRLRKLGLQVRADNCTAIRCYEKIGFEHCGVLRKHVFLDGVWHDVVMMELFLTEAP